MLDQGKKTAAVGAMRGMEDLNRLFDPLRGAANRAVQNDSRMMEDIRRRMTSPAGRGDAIDPYKTVSDAFGGVRNAPQTGNQDVNIIADLLTRMFGADVTPRNRR
jgi:hypothetical protein